jgi:serine protease Do
MKKQRSDTRVLAGRNPVSPHLKGSVILLALACLTWLLVSTVKADPQSGRLSATDPSPYQLTPDGHSMFSQVAAKVRPAVVFIKTERVYNSEGDRTERFSPFEFFRDLMPDYPNDRRIPGGGSGFFIDREGRILTNYHVIRDADKISVVLGDQLDQEEHTAEVIGYDRHSDIAVIQVNKSLARSIVELGDSDDMLIGDWVMAVGTPFGELPGTVTVGVVSAMGRTDLRIINGSADYQDYIQTDASINFGNSGGPLVNLRGEAIGINTAINPSGQGIGFAIPINMAKRVVNQIIEEGRVQYGFIGIVLDELNKTRADELGLDVDKGIYVREVRPDTPAERAGLKHGDVIVEFNGKPVRDDQRFRLMIGSTPVGSTMPMVIVRDNKRIELKITIAERPDDEMLASVEPKAESWLGLRVDDLASTGGRKKLNRSEQQEQGVVVVEVASGSPAEEAGIRKGDIILEVYSFSVSDLKSYVEIAGKLKDRKDPIAFLIKRGRNSTYVPVIPEKKK